MLIVFSGLPGTGKTTLARQLATFRHATYIRIDAIEQAIRNATEFKGSIGPAGYIVAQALAESNLSIGRIVIADCVNPVAASRSGWHEIANRTGSRILKIEVICSDLIEHQRRVESRVSDIPDLIVPNWQAVTKHQYEPWTTTRIIVDTAILSLDDSISLIEKQLDSV